MTRRLRSRSHERGFTIVELMVAVFVVGILFAIAVPTVQNYVSAEQLRGRAREVTDVLRSARNLAMDEGVPRYVLFNPADESYQLWYFDAAAGLWVAEKARVVLEGVSFEAGDLSFPLLPDTPSDSGQTVSSHAAYFDTRGRYPSDAPVGPYTITLHGGLGKTKTLTLYPRTGQVTGA